MFVLSWRTAYALTSVIFWPLFPSLLSNSGNKHQNNPLVSAWTIHHSSTYIIQYVFRCYKAVYVYVTNGNVCQFSKATDSPQHTTNGSRALWEFCERAHLRTLVMLLVAIYETLKKSVFISGLVIISTTSVDLSFPNFTHRVHITNIMVCAKYQYDRIREK